MSLVSTATDTEMADRFVREGLATRGDLIVSGGSGKLFRVDRLMKGGVNYAATDEDGRSWKVRVAHAKAAPAGAVFSGPAGEPDNGSALSRMHPGTVVTFNSGRYADGTRYVVLRDNGDTVSVTKLGGEWGTRYIRGVGYSHLTVVPAASL